MDNITFKLVVCGSFLYICALAKTLPNANLGERCARNYQCLNVTENSVCSVLSPSCGHGICSCDTGFVEVCFVIRLFHFHFIFHYRKMAPVLQQHI